MSSITSAPWKNLQGICMENEYLRVIVLPKLGGKIASVVYKDKDFELAAQNKEEYYKMPQLDAAFEKYDASGMDDAFPNIVEAKVKYGDRELHYPDHGEIWSSSFEWEIGDENLTLFYESKRFAYLYQKRFTLQNKVLRVSYEIQNLSDESFPCLWAFHGLVRYEEDMELLYSEDVKSFENVLQGEELGEVGRHIALKNEEYNFAHVPEKVSETMVKYYVDSRLEKGVCGYRYPTQKMECLLNYNAEKLPYLGVWITAGGFRKDYNCAMEPANGYYDDIRIAWENKSLYWLKKENPLNFDLEMTVKEMED